MVLNDFSWVAKRTNAWDAIGAGAYGLLFALVESVFVFLVAWLLSFLIPRAWKENKRLALLFVLIFMTALWVIFSQVTSIMGLTLPDSVILLLAKIVHRLRYLVLIAAGSDHPHNRHTCLSRGSLRKGGKVFRWANRTAFATDGTVLISRYSRHWDRHHSKHQGGNVKSFISRRDFLKLAGLVPLSWLTLKGLAKFRTITDRPSIQEYSPEKNVLIVVFDAWSAANMSLYGYGRQTTPNLEQLAAKAVVYHNHFAGGNYTNPGTASLLTGTLPWTHRALQIGDSVEKTFVNKNIFQYLKIDTASRIPIIHQLIAY